MNKSIRRIPKVRGRLEHGFLRVQCSSCHKERLVAFNYKRRGFCPGCGARCMAESTFKFQGESCYITRKGEN